MNIIWTDITENFRTLMNDTMVGLTKNTFKESKDMIDMKNLPASIFNGKYSIIFNGINSIETELNSYLIYSYETRLQIAFEINANNSKLSYTNAITDLEAIIRERLSYISWQDNDSIQSITLKVVGKPSLTGGVNNEAFIIFDIDFNVIGRTTYS